MVKTSKLYEMVPNTVKLIQGYIVHRELDDARKSFPMVDEKGKPIYSKTLKWFAEWFGDEEKIKALLDGYLAEYLATHLRDS